MKIRGLFSSDFMATDRLSGATLPPDVEFAAGCSAMPARAAAERCDAGAGSAKKNEAAHPVLNKAGQFLYNAYPHRNGMVSAIGQAQA